MLAMKRPHVQGGAVLAAMLAWAGLSARAIAQDAYPIGVSLGLTGVQGAAGQRQIKAVELAAEMINAKGGVHGHPLKLIVEDDQTKPEISVTKANKLIDQDQVL